MQATYYIYFELSVFSPVELLTLRRYGFLSPEDGGSM
jgi:hypothetical protein